MSEATSTAKFPRPWKVEEAGGTELSVTDANGVHLFRIGGDGGDGSISSSSVLFGDEADTKYLIDQINAHAVRAGMLDVSDIEAVRADVRGAVERGVDHASTDLIDPIVDEIMKLIEARKQVA